MEMQIFFRRKMLVFILAEFVLLNSICSLQRENFDDPHTDREGFSKPLGKDETQQIQSSRVLEILLVTDVKMSHYHGNDLDMYIMTVTNIVTSLFNSPDLYNKLDVRFVKWLRLEQMKNQFIINHDASNTLKNFCDWLSFTSPGNETNQTNAGIALLVTRNKMRKTKHDEDLNTNLEMLGMSDFEGVCTRRHHCILAVDNGLSLAFTISHEIGHSLGMKHDGDGNACPKKGHIMSAQPSSGQHSFTWSTCSAHYLDNFLSSSKSSCLRSDNISITEEGIGGGKPGQIYNVSRQCELAYNDSLNECPGKTNECQQLWCLRPSTTDASPTGLRCTSNLTPKMDGTTCGQEKTCVKGECINDKITQSSKETNSVNQKPSVPCERNSSHETITEKAKSVFSTYIYDPIEFSSHNFPDPYPKNSYHTYIIEAPGGHVIYLIFLVFHLENHSLCLYDYVQIFDVVSEEYAVFCGLLSSPFHVTSQGNKLLLIFHSDAYIEMPGFSARLLFLPKFLF